MGGNIQLALLLILGLLSACVAEIQSCLGMDGGDDRHRELLLDTSILVPLAIAGGITFAIILFIYCCRRYQAILGGSHRDYFGRSFGSSSSTSRGQQRNLRQNNQQGGTRNRSDGFNQCLPWTGTRARHDLDPNQQFYFTGMPATNYQSTFGVPYPSSHQRPNSTTGDGASTATPSAPPKYEAPPPSYTTAMLYATVFKNSELTEAGTRTTTTQDPQSSDIPPPYSRNT